MEIQSLKVIGCSVYLQFICSKCKHSVSSESNFCNNCGRKLEKMNRAIPLKDVCTILTAALKGKPIPKIDEDVREETGQEEISATGIIDESISSRENQIPSYTEPRCPRCKGSKKDCEFYSPKDGICHGIVYPTNPPQFDKCVFDRQ